MLKRSSLSLQTRFNARLGSAGFTLIELLVSMTILVLIVGLFSQVVQSTSSSITHSTKGMDTSDMATVALDRLGRSITGMISSGNATLVVYKNTTGSDGLAMITNGRVRSRTSSGNVSVANDTDVRLAARGYCVIKTPDTTFPTTAADGTPPSVPILSWGDGTITWSATSASQVQGSLPQALADASNDVQQQATNGGTTKMLQFEPVTAGIFRFEVCLLLSNGSIVNSATAQPVLNQHFVSGGTAAFTPAIASATLFPIACNSRDSNDTAFTGPGAQPLYARAIIVGIASLDLTTRRSLTPTQLTTLASTGTLPKPTDNQTPLQAWDLSDSTKTVPQNLKQNFPSSVLQNIRFSQRYYYVN